MDHETIGDIITFNIYRQCPHEHVENIADVSPMYLGCFEPWCTSPNMLADCSALFSDISSMVVGVETSVHALMMTRVRRRSFAEPLVHGGAALAMPKIENRESIGRLKAPRGTSIGVPVCVTKYKHVTIVTSDISNKSTITSWQTWKHGNNVEPQSATLAQHCTGIRSTSPVLLAYVKSRYKLGYRCIYIYVYLATTLTRQLDLKTPNNHTDHWAKY